MIEKRLPLVSIIVPCYNHEKYVQETIDSILNQTYENIELIVIDDGSKDNSVNIIQELADKYKFTFIYRKNKGLSATLNEGIKLSKGKYLCACASDDKLFTDKIMKQVFFMEDNPDYGMCYGKIISFDSYGYKKKQIIPNAKTGWIFNDLLMQNFIPAVTQFIKKEVFDTTGHFDENLLIEDWDMWLRIAEKYKIGYIDEYLACYREHELNISKQTFKMYQAQKYIIEKWSKNEEYDQIIKYWEAEWFNLLAKKYKKESLKYLSFEIFKDRKMLKGFIKLLIPALYFK